MSDNEIPVRITAQVGEFVSGVNEAAESFLKFTKLFVEYQALKELGKMMLEVAEDAAKLAEETNNLAKNFGTTLEAASELRTELGILGISTETYTSAAMKLERQVRTNEETLNKNGLATRDNNGQLLNQTQLMQNAIQWLGQYKEGTDRNVAALTIFGRNVGDINSLLRMNAEAAAIAKKDTEELGIATGEMDVERALEFNQAMNEVKLSFSAMGNEIGKTIMPLLTEMGNWFREQTPLMLKGIKLIEIAFEGLGGAIAGAWHMLQGMGATLEGNFAEAGRQMKLAVAAPDSIHNPAAIPEAGVGNKSAAGLIRNEKALADARKLSEEKLKLQRDESAAMDGIIDAQNQHLLNIGAITENDLLEIEKTNLQKRAQAENTYYEQKLKAAKGDELEQTKILDEQTKYNAKVGTELQKIQNKQSEESMKDVRHLYDTMTTGWQSVTEKLIRGTSTFRDAFKTMCGDLIVEFAKMQVANVAKALWAAAIGKGISISSMIMERSANAVKAASATYASVSSIPFIGWALAPVAAAGAFAGVMAFGLPSAAGGWGEVPNDGLAMIHKKEMILPAPIAEKVRNMTDGGGNSGNNYHFNISALDGNSVKDMFMKNGSVILQALNNQVRNLNPNAMGVR